MPSVPPSSTSTSGVVVGQAVDDLRGRRVDEVVDALDLVVDRRDDGESLAFHPGSAQEGCPVPARATALGAVYCVVSTGTRFFFSSE